WRGAMRTCVFMLATIALTFVAGIEISRGDSDTKAKSDQVDALIKQLGDRQFTRREEASKELEALGKPALRALRKAATSKDPEVRRRAERAFTAIVTRLGLLQQAEELRRTDWPVAHVYSTSFSPDGRHLLAGGDSNTFRIYEVNTGRLI